jgi:hypothetical protein
MLREVPQPTFGEIDMRKLSAILLTVGLSALVPITACAEDKPVQSSQPPYKPGRQVDEGQPVKPGQPPYKPGRQVEGNQSGEGAAAAPSADAAGNEGKRETDGQPVKPGQQPYKPGRQGEDQKEDKK